MYKIEIDYRISRAGSVYARMSVIEADDEFDRCLWPSPFLDATTWETDQAPSWEALQNYIAPFLEYARGEVARRRSLVAAKPPLTVLEI